MSFDLQACSLETVRDLCERHHGYGGAGGQCTLAFAVFEQGGPVAAFSWQPPPPGAAKSVCAELPHGVLSLSRMVAVPKAERELKHISKPLRRQMKHLIDRTRWPVLVTYSDEGEGHTGYVYRCSGWTKTVRAERPIFVDELGNRTSSYSNGKSGGRVLTRAGSTFIQRWEHWIRPKAEIQAYFAASWARVAVPGKVWRSGNPAFTFSRRSASATAR